VQKYLRYSYFYIRSGREKVTELRAEQGGMAFPQIGGFFEEL
jgi:hypothetical protein